MRGSTSTLKEHTAEESLKIFREAGFTKLETARGHLVLCKTHELHLETLAWLRGRKVGLIGVDMPSVNACWISMPPSSTRKCRRASWSF